KDMNIKDLNIKTFKTSHDTDSVGYVFTSNNKALVYITDTGYINVKNHPLLLNKEAYIFESNHDIDLLMNNENYPYYLKQRILSDKGHLSNKDSAYYLSNFVGNKTKTIFLVHLSEQNNDPNIALETLKTNLKKKDIQINNIIIAKQMDKSELVEV
ncbi:MAG: MBL fold metallo-hydrolase, partial [Bacilli bacterium]